MNKRLTLAAILMASFGTAGLLHAQHGGGSAGGDSSATREAGKGMMGGMQMSPEMKLHHRLMMQTRISPQDPAALLALREELQLTDEQVQQLERRLAQAREAAVGVLTEAQRQRVAALPAEPRSMMQMHKMMMDRMGDDGMEGMCPMCQMMGDIGMQQGASTDENPVQRVDLNAAAQAQLDRLVDNYLEINEQLAQDQAQGVAAGLERVQEAARALAESAPASLKEQARAAVQTANARPQSVNEAREAIKPLSEAVVMLVKAAPPSDTVAETLYVAYCPMAKASWLQTSKDVINPYMGQAMLNCGSIQNTIKPQS